MIIVIFEKKILQVSVMSVSVEQNLIHTTYKSYIVLYDNSEFVYAYIIRHYNMIHRKSFIEIYLT